MSRAHNKDVPSQIAPSLTDPFLNTRQNGSCVQEQADADVHFDPNQSENSDSLRNKNSSIGISLNSSNEISIKAKKGTNNAVESNEDDPNSLKDQSQTLEDDSEELEDVTDRTKRGPPSVSPIDRSSETRNEKRGNLDKQKDRGKKDFKAKQPKKVRLPHKPIKTTSDQSPVSFEEVNEVTDESSKILKDEEDECSDRSEEDHGTQPELASLVGKSNKMRYQKRKNLDHKTKNQKDRGNKDFDTQHSQKTNDTTAGKSRGSIEVVGGSNNEPREPFKDEEDGAQKLQTESKKSSDEKQPANKESTWHKCWKMWKIIICVFVVLSAITGVVVSSLALSRKSITPIAREPTDGAWSHWGNWTECSVTCGKGIHHRSRNCSNPVPSHGGRYCAGPPLEYQMCPIQPCPVSFPAFTAFNPKQIQSERLQSWELLDHSGSDFNSTSGTFTCSVAGIYLFSLTLVKKGTGKNPVAKVHCHLYKNNDQLMSLILNPSYNIGNDAISSTAIMRLKKEDRVYLGQCTDPESTLEKWTSFTGVLQSRD